MTSIEVKLDQFPLSPEARNMLRRKFGVNPDEALAENEICRECLVLPLDERNRLAEKAIKSAHQTKTGAQRFKLPSRKLEIEIRALLF